MILTAIEKFVAEKTQIQVSRNILFKALWSWLFSSLSSTMANNMWLNTCRIQNPNIPRAVRVGTAHGGAAGCGGAGQNKTPTGRVTLKPTVLLALQGFVDNGTERPFASRMREHDKQLTLIGIQ